MKIISEKIVKGKRRITVEVETDETILAFDQNKHYRLGYPLEDDVLQADRLLNSVPVFWCDIEQKWVDDK